VKMEIETFKEVTNYTLGSLLQSEPSVFNRMVRVKRYRVTIEEIKEPDEVIIDRLRKLWKENDNHHNREPLIVAAKKYGIDLLEEGA